MDGEKFKVVTAAYVVIEDVVTSGRRRVGTRLVCETREGIMNTGCGRGRILSFCLPMIIAGSKSYSWRSSYFLHNPASSSESAFNAIICLKSFPALVTVSLY